MSDIAFALTLVGVITLPYWIFVIAWLFGRFD